MAPAAALGRAHVAIPADLRLPRHCLSWNPSAARSAWQGRAEARGPVARHVARVVDVADASAHLHALPLRRAFGENQRRAIPLSIAEPRDKTGPRVFQRLVNDLQRFADRRIIGEIAPDFRAFRAELTLAPVGKSRRGNTYSASRFTTGTAPTQARPNRVWRQARPSQAIPAMPRGLDRIARHGHGKRAAERLAGSRGVGSVSCVHSVGAR